MFTFLVTYLIFFISVEFFVYSWYILIDLLFFKNFFLFIFFTFFYLNFFVFKNVEKARHNIDLLYKYFLILVKTPSFFTNVIVNKIRKFFIFTVYFRHQLTILSYKIIFGWFFRKFFIVWRPLFKKFSYFGYYRSNRSKWIK